MGFIKGLVTLGVVAAAAYAGHHVGQNGLPATPWEASIRNPSVRATCQAKVLDIMKSDYRVSRTLLEGVVKAEEGTLELEGMTVVAYDAHRNGASEFDSLAITNQSGDTYQRATFSLEAQEPEVQWVYTGEERSVVLQDGFPVIEKRSLDRATGDQLCTRVLTELRKGYEQ